MLTQLYSSGTGVTTIIAIPSIAFFFSGSKACLEPGPDASREAPQRVCWEMGNRLSGNTKRLYVVFICELWPVPGPN
jgi:hypothetical protein